MKVLLISENAPSIYGGIERHCYNIKLLFSNDKDITVESISKEDIGFHKINIIDKIVFNEKKLRQYINNSNCDIVHIHGFASLAVWQAIRIASELKKRIIYTAHFHPFERLDNPMLGKLFFYLLLKPYIKKIDTIITINKEDTAFFKKYHNNIIMIPNWLAKPIIENNHSKKKNIILFVGRNDHNKSPQYLNDLPSKYEVHCVTNTSKNLRNDFIFHTQISDNELNELYRQASLLIVPSRYEAFSYVVLEALAQGTPVLISDNVRIADYIGQKQGVTIFKYGDHNDFLNKIETAIQQKVDINFIKTIFSETTIKKQLTSIYLRK